MASRWLNIFFRYAGYTHSLKQKIVGADNWVKAAPYAAVLIISELGFAAASLPMYLIVRPEAIQEEGRIFPRRRKAPPQLQVYIVRRKISLATFFGAGGVFALKLAFVGFVSSYLLGVPALLAAVQDWTFDAAGDYVYDSSKIEITGGAARLKDIGSTATVSSANSGFTGSAAGWTYADWLQPANTNVNGAYVSTGGLPNGHVDITMTSSRRGRTIAGYYQQATTTTANSPDIATLSLDWESLTYTSPSVPTTYRVYAFVETVSGAPASTSTAVWSSPEITGVSGWASSTVIDVRSKMPTAGTYYIKFAAYAVIPAGANASFTYVSGFDNVALHWSKTTVAYSAAKPTTTPVASLAPAGAKGWTGFVETATKNGGEIYYQLSDDDGATWKYWNNSSWAAIASSTDYNIAAVINSNIMNFSAAAGKIRWRAFLAGNGSQQVILDNISIGYTQNATPAVQSLTAAQDASSGHIRVDYNLQDGDSDQINLLNYEYSLTGAFAGEQSAMTPVLTDPAHSGIAGLASSPAGAAHAFIWNAAADLGAVYSATVYVRLRASDGIANSAYAVSPAFALDYVAPLVANVAASQVPAGSDIRINYDLFDNTAGNIAVELQISSDGGLTWAVPVASVSGDVGPAVSSGNGKAIIWQAGADYQNQEQNNMLARVRAKDKYQNQGGYVDSAAFILDNRPPVVAAGADLLAQPLAGASAVLVGGSFSEGNPGTNDFYLAINGGAYGPAAAGDAGTATPSDKSVPVGTVLDGNDYISKVKIVHTDDFGHLTANENVSPDAAYKYVKPYVPPAPTVGNPGESSLDITINKHAAETDGLEYAIYESTQNMYAQSDGALGASPYWQVAGTVAVSGLSQPISNYIFQVKSRNASDSGHSAASESDLSSGASSDYRSPQITINSVA